MATRKKTTFPVIPQDTLASSSVKFSPIKFLRLLAIVVLAGILIFGVVKKYRHLFIVGVVNTTPITRWQLDKMVFDRYGKSTLEELVNVTLLDQLSKQNKVTVTEDDIKNETTDLETRLGGKEALKANMERFGVDEAKLREEIRSILLQRKLSQKLFNLTASDEEISKYYSDNKALFAKQTIDEVRDDIKKSLEQQKSQQQFTDWFQEQRTKAKISLFI